MIKLLTTFNGKPAPGGLFDPTTAIFYKACRSLSGGQHPHRPDLGGLDSPVVERLIAFRCEKIVLEIPGASYEIPFERFLEYGYSQRWNDPRFPNPRWYCQARHWNNDYTAGHETPITRQAEQASLFCAEELQDLSMKERLIS